MQQNSPTDQHLIWQRTWNDTNVNSKFSLVEKHFTRLEGWENTHFWEQARFHRILGTLSMQNKIIDLEFCPECRKPLSGHEFGLFASIIDHPKLKSRLEAFLKAIKSRSWDDVLSFHEWDGGSDVIQVYALLCPRQTLSLVLIRNPLEVLDSERIIGIEPLDLEESRRIFNLMNQVQWHPIL